MGYLYLLLFIAIAPLGDKPCKYQIDRVKHQTACLATKQQWTVCFMCYIPRRLQETSSETGRKTTGEGGVRRIHEL
jgi:hypothetical protein